MRNNGLIIGTLAVILIVLFMIPITGMLVTPEEPQPLNTPIYELNNKSLNYIFEHQMNDDIESINDNSFLSLYGTTAIKAVGKNLLDIDTYEYKRRFTGEGAIDASGVVTHYREYNKIVYSDLTSSFNGLAHKVFV